MPVMRTYKCPDCGGSFRHLHMLRDDPPPEVCELCNSFMGEDPQPELSAPAISAGHPKTVREAVDSVYRQAEQFNGVTNMKDNLQMGEVAAMPGSLGKGNPVQQVMQESGFNPWGGGATFGGAGMAGGPAPAGGAAAISGLAPPPHPNMGGRPALRAIQGTPK